MAKKMKTFRSGGGVKHYYTGSQVSQSSDSEDSSDLRGKALPPFDEMESINSDVRRALARNMRDKELTSSDPVESTNASVRRALAGERPSDPLYTEMSSPKAKDNKFVKAANKIQKSQDDRRNMEAGTSRGSVPFQFQSRPARLGSAESQAVEGVYPEQLLNLPSLGVKAVAASAKNLANMTSRNPLQLAEKAKSAGKEVLSAAGRRLKEAKDFLRAGSPGRDAAVTNPNAWAAGPKGMEKIAKAEGKAAATDARAAAAAAKKKAAQAKKDAKDPLMNARPGADKAKPTPKTSKAKPTPKTSKAKPKSKYETDEAMDASFGYKGGGSVEKFAKGGSVSSASSRADGCAVRGKTKGMISKMKSGGMYGGKGAC